jgi:hypothetical protein
MLREPDAPKKGLFLRIVITVILLGVLLIFILVPAKTVSVDADALQPDMISLGYIVSDSTTTPHKSSMRTEKIVSYSCVNYVKDTQKVSVEIYVYDSANTAKNVFSRQRSIIEGTGLTISEYTKFGQSFYINSGGNSFCYFQEMNVYGSLHFYDGITSDLMDTVLEDINNKINAAATR